MPPKIIRPLKNPVRTALRAPGDKSISHRALILGGIAEGETTVKNLAKGGAIDATKNCLSQLGVKTEEREGKTVIRGGKFEEPKETLCAATSGTTMRLICGLLASQPFRATITGEGSLLTRPMRRVAEPLRMMGAGVALTNGEYAPITIEGARPTRPINYILPVPSAQVKSAILIAGLFADGEVFVTDLHGTRDHTERLIRRLGGNIAKEGNKIILQPGALRGAELAVPGDFSQCAYWLALGALVKDSRVAVSDVGLNPTRVGFLEILLAMGAKVAVERDSSGYEPTGNLAISFSPLEATTVSKKRAPALIDEVPLLALVATQAEGTTTINGVGELRHKESDRLEGAVKNLNKMGAKISVEGESLIVKGPTPLRGAYVDTQKDHRLAMTFAVAGLIAEGETAISEPECVADSYPDFWEVFDGIIKDDKKDF